MSGLERRSKKQRANELKLERLINGESNNNWIETIFPKKNWVNVTSDRNLAVNNASKDGEEKTKGETGNNAAINLTTETNRTFIDQKAGLEKNSK